MSGTKPYISYNIGKYVDGIGHTITQHLSWRKNEKTKNSIVNSFYCVVDFPVPDGTYFRTTSI
jgi:hypothetical protein